MKRVRHTQYQTEPIQIKNQEQFTTVASSYMKKQKLEITCQECKKVLKTEKKQESKLQSLSITLQIAEMIGLKKNH